MSLTGFFVLLLSIIVGYFGLGAIAGTPATVAAALVGIFVAVLLVAWIYESVSRRRWMV